MAKVSSLKAPRRGAPSPADVVVLTLQRTWWKFQSSTRLLTDRQEVLDLRVVATAPAQQLAGAGARRASDRQALLRGPRCEWCLPIVWDGVSSFCTMPPPVGRTVFREL